MGSSRRGPGARPEAGAGTARRPRAGRSRPGAPSARTSSARRVAPVESDGTEAAGKGKADAGTGENGARAGTGSRQPSARAPKPGRGSGRRPSVTSRAAVLALVVAVVLVSYAYPLRTWYDQHRERAELEAESTRLEQSVDELEAELRRWDDPAYVAARARERLNFVLPGEKGYVVVPDPAATQAAEEVGPNGLPPAGEGEWYERLWGSVEAADARPPEDGE